jgi:glycosyltransferase involved in cell wall biosynthesis
VGDAGIIVPPADAKALAKAIEHLLQSPEERKKYAQAGLTRVNSVFSWKKAAREVAEVYREAIHGHRRSS